MAEILCGPESAVVVAAAAAGAGEVSEVVVVAPIVRATRRRRMDYARRYGASDQHKRNRSQAESHGDGGGREGEEEDVRDRILGAGGMGDDTWEERDDDDDDDGILIDPRLQLLAQDPLPLNDWHAAAAAEAEAAPCYGMASVCGRRRDMEDAVSIRPAFLASDEDDLKGFHFYGVFDGHGCSHVAISCKDRMHDLISQELNLQLQNPASAVKDADGTPPDSRSFLDWAAIMGRGFARMDSEVVLAGRSPGDLRCRCELQEASKCDHVGSTAVVAVVTGDRLVVANCGDSRAVMCRRGVPVPLSLDHKPDRPDELQRIQAAGGRVIYWDGARVLGVLAMSRAIGDNHLKPYVTSDPEVTVTARTDADEFLILASDGLWDVVSNATACQVVRMCFKGSGTRNNTTTAGTATKANPTANGINGVSSSPQPLPLVLAAESEDADSEPQERGGGGDCRSGSDKACLKAADLLTKLALARRSADNVSVVVVDLRRRRRRRSKTTTSATHR